MQRLLARISSSRPSRSPSPKPRSLIRHAMPKVCGKLYNWAHVDDIFGIDKGRLKAAGIKNSVNSSPKRVWLAPAYVLHQYAYRDSGRIVEVFTSEHGRITLFARGAN